jgi:heme oxygenase (mycobilin-producing)
MTVVKINAITVPADSGDELARRFAARAGAVDNQDGFEGFELLQPTDGRTTWLVVTRWRDDKAFDDWRTSPAFEHGHAQARSEAAGQGHAHGQGEAAGQGHAHGQGERAGHGHAAAGGGSAKPVATSSELWSFEIAGGSPGR